MLQMTFDEYDELIDSLKNIDIGTYWPDLDTIDFMRAKPEKFLTFACYLLETNKEPDTNSEKYSKKNLLNFVNENLELI